MADKMGPFDTVPWSQDQWYRFAPAWAPSGILGTPGTSMSTGPFGVTAAGLTLTVNAANQTSRAWIRGAGWEPEAATKTATATANAHGSWSRRDRLVIRRDLGTPGFTLAVVAGTAAATPAAPTLTQSDTGIWEESICSFLVPPASATTLSSFTDERVWIGPNGIIPPAPVIASGNVTSRADGIEESWFVLTIPDPGFPYRIEANGWVRLFVTNGTRADVRLRAGASGGSDAALPILTFSSGMSNDTTGLDLTLPTRTTPATITGAGRLVGFCQRSAGAGSWEITPAPSVYYRVVPA